MEGTMPDDTDPTPTGSGEGGRESRPAGGETPPPARTEAQGAADEDDNLEAWDPKRAASTIRAQRESERTLRTELEAARRERDTLKRKDETEGQRKDRELEESKSRIGKLTDRLRRATVRTEVFELAGSSGISNPKLATKLLDLDKVEWEGEGEDAEPKNLEKLLKDLKVEYPELAGRAGRNGGSADGGTAATGETSGGDMNELIRSRAGR